MRFEFIRMPDSTGFGDYTEAGQVVPVTFQGKSGNYVHSMFLDDDAPIAGGREIWGFPKKLGSPVLRVEKDTLLGTLDYGGLRIASGQDRLGELQVPVAEGVPGGLVGGLCGLVELRLPAISRG